MLKDLWEELRSLDAVILCLLLANIFIIIAAFAGVMVVVSR